MLRGEWLGHALHPVLTDVVLGTWTSASLLDLFGGRDSSPRPSGSSAPVCRLRPDRLGRLGRVVVRGPRDKRVGLVHAVTNGVAVGVYTASWLARRRGRHGTGAGLALAGAAVSGVGAYLGGHLAEARKVGSRHPAYEDGPVSDGAPPYQA